MGQKTENIQDSFPLPDIQYFRRVKPKKVGHEVFRVQGNAHKGLLITASFALDNFGDFWLRVRINSPKDLKQSSILFVVRNFFQKTDDVFSFIGNEGNYRDPSSCLLLCKLNKKALIPRDEVMQDA